MIGNVSARGFPGHNGSHPVPVIAHARSCHRSKLRRLEHAHGFLNGPSMHLCYSARAKWSESGTGPVTLAHGICGKTGPDEAGYTVAADDQRPTTETDQRR